MPCQLFIASSASATCQVCEEAAGPLAARLRERLEQQQQQQQQQQHQHQRRQAALDASSSTGPSMYPNLTPGAAGVARLGPRSHFATGAAGSMGPVAGVGGGYGAREAAGVQNSRGAGGNALPAGVIAGHTSVGRDEAARASVDWPAVVAKAKARHETECPICIGPLGRRGNKGACRGRGTRKERDTPRGVDLGNPPKDSHASSYRKCRRSAWGNWGLLLSLSDKSDATRLPVIV